MLNKYINNMYQGVFMELRVLKYFLAVAREESVSGAAKAVYVTQPTLSRQMMDLEKELGVKLFNRGKKNKRITLTEEGMLLRKRAGEIVTLADKTKNEFAAREEILSGEVYIGGGETDGMRPVARAARDLQRKYPHVRYHLFSGNAEAVTERLDKGLLDFGVLVGAAGLEKYNYMALPGADAWGLLMRKEHPLAKKRFIRPEDLNDVPLLVSRQALENNELAGWFGHGPEKLNLAATYNLVYNAALMVEEGVGCALSLDKLVHTSKTSRLCFKPLEPKLEARLYLVWKKSQVFSKAAEQFLECLRHAVLA